MNIDNLNKTVIRGVCVCVGVAQGKAFFLKKQNAKTLPTGTPDEEKLIFAKALEKARTENQETQRKAMLTLERGEAEIFEIYGMLMEDSDFIELTERNIMSGMSAYDAVGNASGFFAGKLRNSDSEYLSARALDIIQVGKQICDVITDTGSRETGIPDGSIIIADDIEPALIIGSQREHIKGIVTTGGSRTSHASILARSFGIPSIAGCSEIPEIHNGEDAILDADNESLILSPDRETYDRYSADVSGKNTDSDSEIYRTRDAVTASGVRIFVYANISSAAEAKTASENGADGIGLFRSEFMFTGNGNPPTEEEQFMQYRRTAELMDGKRVIIRTLDVGSDKKPDFMSFPTEENPALGLRGVRVYNKYPEIIHTQLRAILRASAYGHIAVMFPMVCVESEFVYMHNAVEKIKRELDAEHIPYDNKIEIGVMIETPAAAILSDKLAVQADFFSVGTNDLFQYTLASDRMSGVSEEFAGEGREAIVRLIGIAAGNIHRYHGKWIGICGELAADTEITDKLISAGVDELSVSPSYILQLKKRICGI